MRHLPLTLILGTLVLPMLVGCQSSNESASSSSSPVAPATKNTVTANAATMKLVVVTETYDSAGNSQDQQFDTVDATPDVIRQRFKALDWKHATNRYHIGLTGGESIHPAGRN